MIAYLPLGRLLQLWSVLYAQWGTLFSHNPTLAMHGQSTVCLCCADKCSTGSARVNPRCNPGAKLLYIANTVPEQIKVRSECVASKRHHRPAPLITRLL